MSTTESLSGAAPSSNSIYDVVLIGGGVAAVESARRLLAAGLSVRLIDKGSMERDPEKPHDLASGIMGAGTFSDGKYSFFPAGTKIWQLRDKTAILRVLRESIDELNAAHEVTRGAEPLPIVQATEEQVAAGYAEADGPFYDNKVAPVNLVALLACIALAYQVALQGVDGSFLLSACVWAVATACAWAYGHENRLLEVDIGDAALLLACAAGFEWWHPGRGLLLTVIGFFSGKYLLTSVFGGDKEEPLAALPPRAQELVREMIADDQRKLFDTDALVAQVEQHFAALVHHDAEPSILADTADDAWKFKAYTSIYLPLAARLKLVRDASTLLAPHALMEHVVHKVTRSPIDGIYEIAYQVRGNMCRALASACPSPPLTPLRKRCDIGCSSSPDNLGWGYGGKRGANEPCGEAQRNSHERLFAMLLPPLAQWQLSRNALLPGARHHCRRWAICAAVSQDASNVRARVSED
jgi:hypothetical protein